MCKVCGQETRIAIFKGGDWCCDDCRKIFQGETTNTDTIVRHLIKRSPNMLTPWEISKHRTIGMRDSSGQA